eukprot:1865924-Prymnesium_polylepis.1
MWSRGASIVRKFRAPIGAHMLRAVSCLALAGSASAFALGGSALSMRSAARCASAAMEGGK